MPEIEISVRPEIALSKRIFKILSGTPGELSGQIAVGRLGLRESHKLSLAGCDSQATQPNLFDAPRGEMAHARQNTELSSGLTSAAGLENQHEGSSPSVGRDFHCPQDTRTGSIRSGSKIGFASPGRRVE